MKDLLLITNHYPYLIAEPFLENEINYLSCVFDNIYIFSINAPYGERRTRMCPHNVYSFPVGENNTLLKYVKSVFFGLIGGRNIFKINETNLIHFISALYSRGRAKLAKKKIFKILKDNHISFHKLTIYSFWFSYQAITAVMLADSLNNKRGNSAHLVARAHGYDLYWERAWGNYIPFQDRLLKTLDFCFPCSSAGKNYLDRKYPWAKNKIVVSRLGTKDYGKGNYTGEKVLLTCCTLEPLKRMSLFAKAFSKLVHYIPDVKWVCVGDGEEFELIKEILEKEHTTNNVIMLGRISNQEVAEYYKKNSIMYFCNVSTTEGLPVSIMEAQSFGIPVIATNVGGTGELVNDDNGRLVNMDIDEYKLCDLLREMIMLPNNIYLSKRQKSREQWEELSSAEINYTSFVSLL